ncbi:hypothetical protein CRUP_031407, partial [Coryphaenoides rupestris]
PYISEANHGSATTTCTSDRRRTPHDASDRGRTSILGFSVVSVANMGTVLSLSPTSKKGAIMDSGTAGAVVVVNNHNNKGDKSIKRSSVFVSTLTWKKLVPNSAKKKNSAKKVSPNPATLAPCTTTTTTTEVSQLNHENAKKSHAATTEERRAKAPIPVPVPCTVPCTVPTVPITSQKITSVQKQKQKPKPQEPPSGVSLLSPRRVVIQASTGELLRCLGAFVCRRCRKLTSELTCAEEHRPHAPDAGLAGPGFITPANLVFVYLLCRDGVAEDVDSAAELQGAFLTCLYLAYSYMGNEISYPLKPFVVDANKDVFWDTSLGIIDRMSGDMLRLNADPHFFTEVFQELKDQRPDSESNLDR